MKQNVNILCLYKGSYPNGQAMANRLRNYAKAICSENLSFTIASEGQKVARPSKEMLFEGHEVWHWRKMTSFDRIPIVRDLNAYIKRLKIYKYALINSQYKIFFSSGYRWPQMLVFVVIAKLAGKKYVIELNELPHSIKASRLDSDFSNAVKRFITIKLVFPFVDGFICISGALEEYIKPYVSKKCKIIRVPILTDVKLEQEISRKPSDFIFHAGTLTEYKDGILTVLEAYGRAVKERNLNLRFEFSNFNTLPKIKQAITAIINKYGLEERITFHNYLSHKEMETKLSSCYLVVINKPSNPRNRFNFSTKLGECMAYGIPLISTAVGESKNYLKHRENSLVVNDSSDPNELANLIFTLYENKELAAKIGEGARITANNNFHYSNYSQALTEYFLHL